MADTRLPGASRRRPPLDSHAMIALDLARCQFDGAYWAYSGLSRNPSHQSSVLSGNLSAAEVAFSVRRKPFCAKQTSRLGKGRSFRLGLVGFPGRHFGSRRRLPIYGRSLRFQFNRHFRRRLFQPRIGYHFVGRRFRF